jgi:hypothetical protein
LTKIASKWGLVFKGLLIIIPVVGLKMIFHQLNFDTFAVGTLTSALVTGVFFVIAIILAGVLTDFKESEKMVGELATSIENIYMECRLIGSPEEVADILHHTKDLVHTVMANFKRRGNWKVSEINSVVEEIDDDIRAFMAKDKNTSVLLRIRTELSNIKRISYRVEMIKETTFLTAAHAILETGVTGIIFVLLISKIEPFWEGLFLFGVLSLLFTSIILLINDMDNPFEGYVKVDLRAISKLEKHLDIHQTVAAADNSSS